MRKKSKKKQIVAMTLALSVLSSSVGMCGAAAATDPPPDADGSGLQVTVVPLADNTETPAPTAEPTTNPATVLYYNPDGGSYYHTDPNCSANGDVKKEYLPYSGNFLYSEVNDMNYKNLKPCPYCNAPARVK